MATVAGTIKSLSDGVFHVKDEAGNIKVLKVGDTIFENDTIYGDSSNASTSKIEIELSGNDVIVLSEGQKQLIDASLIETAFGTEELYFTRDALNQNLEAYNAQEDVVSDLRDAEFTDETLEVVTENAEGENQNGNAEEDATEEETAEGEEEAEDETTGEAQFQARDGDATNVASDLRDATFRARTQTFIDRELFTNESEDRLGFDNIDRSNPFTPTNPTDPDRPTSELRPGEETTPEETDPTPTEPATPSKVIANLSIDDVSAYESEGFLIFTVSLDTEVSSDVTFTYTTSGITATGNKDYDESTGIITIPEGSTSVTIQIPIADDYISDNGETMKVTLSNVEGDAEVVKPEGIGTILDNPVNNPENGTTNTPAEPGGYGEEDTVYAIITGAKIVNEGNTSTYTVELVDKDGNPVIVSENTDVTVIYTNRTTQNSDTEYDNNDTITVTIPANGSSNTFTVVSTDDYISDNGENYNVAIEKVDTNEFENVVIGDKDGNNKNVTTTILDNPSTTEQPTIPTDPSNPNNPDDGINYGQEDTVYAIITGATTVNEGNTTTYTVKLVDKDGNTVVVTNPTTVTVKYTNVTTQDGDTEYNNNNTINVTIPANGSSNTFTVESIDDYFADNGENYNVAIEKVDTNEFENVVIGDKNGNNKDVTTTILDDTDNTPNNPNDGVEANHESVIIKLVACDASGNPILEADGKTYKIVNEVNEGDNAKYMALAFEPNSTTFTTETKLSLQGGTVTVDTSNGTAIGVISQTKEDGSEDFILVKDKVVNIEVAFEVVTVDDYISDNNEIYTVSINSGSYTHPTTPIYENVTINNEAVTTTIKDNSNPVDNTTPHNPNDPTNHNQESDKEIVLIKLFAADENGNVIKDGNGNYLLANEAEEGTNANYIAYAFENGTTTFNDSTKLSVQTGTIDISFQNDTATGAPTKTLTDGTQDFNNTPRTSVSIGQSFSTEVFKDLSSESTEKYKVVIDNNSYNGNYESVNIDTTPVTTTIHDEKLFVKIEAITDIANEGANLKYKIVIVNKDGEEVKVPAGKTLTVDLSYEGNTSKEATDGDDYTKVSTVTIMGGNSSQEFEVSTKDDYYAEGDEGLKITITGTNNATTEAFENLATHTEANGAPSDEITTIGTIKDNQSNIDKTTDENNTDDPTDPNGSYDQDDTVYAIITGTQTIKEGNTSTNYTVKLVDKDENTVTPTKDTKITVTYNNITTQNGDTQYDNSDEIEVTILANTSEITFTVETKDDVYKDDGEQFNLTITDIQNTGEFENVKIGDKDGNQKNVISTIKDNTTSGTETNIDDVKIVLVAVATATTTIADITDNDGKLIITNTNETPEGGNLYYMAVAVDNDGKPVSTQGGTVTVNYGTTTDNTDKDATAGTDYDNTTVVSTTLGTVFSVNAKDDYYAEGDENFTVKITDLTNSPYESPSIDTSKDTVTSTITDNPAQDTENPNTPTEPTDPNNPNDTTKKYGEEDTVYVKITQAPSTIEGGNLVHTVTLVDKNGDPVTVPAGQTVTVNLTYSAKSGDFREDDLSTIVKQVLINGGTNHKDFTNISIDDFTAEGDEIYNVTISSVTQSGAFENVAISSTNSTTGTIKDGVILGDPVNAKVYEDGLNTSATTENDLGKSLGITNPNADTYTVSFDKTITTTDKTSNGQVITYSYNTDGTILTATRADNEVVFTVELKKDGSGNDVYDFKLKTVMDHEYGNNGKNEFDMPFSFNVTSNGTTSSNKTFNVTVVDSVPSAEPIIANTKEDTEVIVRLADDDFKTGEQVTINGTAHNIGATGIAIYEKGDTTKQIGSLTINSNGTVTFTPIEDYSNHDTTKSPEFTYTVKDFDGDEASSTVTINVKPVADTITITPSTPTMTEDDENTKEGTHQVALGLTKPSLSKDQTDKNSDAGDHPERNGEITLTFTNGDKVTGAKIFNGATQIGSDITSANQELKVVIVTSSGSTDVDYTYHHADITASNPSGAIYLTEAEYEALIIRHAEDNDTDIKIDISVTSYELDDDNKPLSTTDADLYETATVNMTVEIDPATDDISLAWDTATGGSISTTTNTDDTFTFITKDEGAYFNAPISLKALLTKTSGTETFDGSKADLDGSEKRTYTIEGIPEGTIVTLGGQVAVANASRVATIVFNNTNNKAADPEFSMKLPEHYSGTISNAKITLSVQDKGVDSGDELGDIKTAEVYFNVEVTPVADLATIQVAQAVGYEDAGRSEGNISNAANAGDITNAADGIPLDIKVSSDDKDGSETFNVTIKDIPNGAALLVWDSDLDKNVLVTFDGSGNATLNEYNIADNTTSAYTGTYITVSGDEVTIIDYQNDHAPKFIPPHNSDEDYTLKVNAQTVDTDPSYTSAWIVTDKEIKVIVKDVADVPVGTELENPLIDGKYVYKATEAALDAADNKFALKDIYEVSGALNSYDSSSETLSIAVDLPAGFSMEGAFYIENGKYVFKAIDIDSVNVITPKNFSGEADLDLTYITTENAGDSKTHDTETVKIFVSPSAEAEINNTTTGNEDVLFKVDFGIVHKNGDTDETLETVKIKAVDVTGKDFTLYIGNSTGTALTTLTADGDGYYVLTAKQANNIYAKNTTEHKHGADYKFEVKYTVKDSKFGTTDSTAEDTKTGIFDYTLNITAVTDQPGIEAGTVADGAGYTVSGSTVTVNAVNTTFEVPVKTTSADQDSSENVTKIVISGVPMGVEVVGGTYYGYSGSEHNGIWVIEGASLTDTPLNADGATKNVGFTVNEGANFDSRSVTITTYTKDAGEAEELNATTSITIDRDYTDGTGPGKPPQFTLGTKPATIYEDNKDDTDTYNLGESITVTNNGGNTTGGYAITISEFPTGTTVSGASYSYEKTEAGVTKTYYVVVGNGNAADAMSKLSNVIVTPPANVNDSDNTTKSMTFKATIATYDGGTFYKGNEINHTEHILPVTDDMTITIAASDTNEDTSTDFTIKLENPADGVNTALVDGKVYITITENYESNSETATGKLYFGGNEITIDGNGKYVIDLPDGYNMGDELNLTYEPGENRHGNVTIEATVKNYESESWDPYETEIKDSSDSVNIKVNSVLDAQINENIITVTATSVEDTVVDDKINMIPVDILIDAGLKDPSESITNIMFDKIPTGFIVYYGADDASLTMATNTGTSGSDKFDLTPHISGDIVNDVNYNKWILPVVSGEIPAKIYIKAPENYSGNFDFDVDLYVKELDQSPVKVTKTVTAEITPVADGVTIDPTLTFGEAFSWVDLKLNANMKDVDGSEVMNLEIGGLGADSQFRLEDGTTLSATHNGTNWILNGIKFDQINNIQFTSDESVANVTVKATTTEVATDGTTVIGSASSEVSGSFKLDIKDANINFDNLDVLSALKEINTIDLSNGSHNFSNIKLSDVLEMTDANKELIIKGESNDNVTLKGNWTKGSVEAGFDVYTNSDDSSVKIKVQTEISDGITS